MGTSPDNPLLLRHFLLAEPDNTAHKEHQRAYYHDQFRLLMDTIADDCVPGHWRCICLDHVYLPLQAMQKLADGESCRRQLTRLYAELRIISHYFQASMSQGIYNPVNGEQ